jgi:hypothetical protein
LKKLGATALEIEAMIRKPAVESTIQQVVDEGIAATTAPQPTEADLIAQETMEVLEATDETLPDLGTEDNPYTPTTEAQIMSVPIGSFFADPDGNVYQRKDF